MNIKFTGYEYGVNEFYTAVSFEGDYSGEVHLQTPLDCNSVHNFEGNEYVDNEIKNEIIGLAEEWFVEELDKNGFMPILSHFMCEDISADDIDYELVSVINEVVSKVKYYFLNNPAFDVEPYNIREIVENALADCICCKGLLIRRIYTYNASIDYNYDDEDDIADMVINSIKNRILLKNCQ